MIMDFFEKGDRSFQKKNNDFGRRRDKILSIDYIFVKYGIKIPIDNIEVIKWNYKLEGNE